MNKFELGKGDNNSLVPSSENEIVATDVLSGEQLEFIRFLTNNSKLARRKNVERRKRFEQHFLWHAKLAAKRYTAICRAREGELTQDIQGIILPFFNQLVDSGVYRHLSRWKDECATKPEVFSGDLSITDTTQVDYPGYAITVLGKGYKGEEPFKSEFDVIFRFPSSSQTVEYVKRTKRSLQDTRLHATAYLLPPNKEPGIFIHALADNILELWGHDRPYVGQELPFTALHNDVRLLPGISPVFLSQLAKQIENGTVAARIGWQFQESLKPRYRSG